ncbi:Uncharacterised protein [Mycobacteroides abscessus subsp. abscessus]|nr:Uncharacterised protein [Mycobacteroides abscessus subsp. abscessus]
MMKMINYKGLWQEMSLFLIVVLIIMAIYIYKTNQDFGM